VEAVTGRPSLAALTTLDGGARGWQWPLAAEVSRHAALGELVIRELRSLSGRWFPWGSRATLVLRLRREVEHADVKGLLRLRLRS
jgi:hypothetical protein